MITITTIRAYVGLSTYTEQKTYKVFGLTILKAFNNVIMSDGSYYTVKGVVDSINKKRQEATKQWA
ncbi:hypothetical protein ACE193_21075 [Bernardetia sp. OM2101]|uniref:hypothetical protein n=1 Tax=Bernardetia sp. OM2101 TaxID=3344876 RepID=UPI0035CFE1C6